MPMKSRFTLLWLSIVCILNSANATDTLLVVGDATWGGWSLANTSVMKKIGDNRFSYIGYLNANKEFKFLTETQWDKDEYRNANATDPYILGEGTLKLNGDDDKFKVKESGNYVLTCDLNAMTIQVEKATYQEHPVYHNVLYMVGDATEGGWLIPAAQPLTQDDSDPFRFSATRVLLDSNGSFKIGVNCYSDFDQKFYFRDANDDNRVSEDATDDRQWRVAEDGLYDISVDLLDRSISITKSAGTDRVDLGRFVGYTQNGSTVTVTTQNGIMEITSYNDYVIKVFNHRTGDNTGERRSITVNAQPLTSFTINENDKSLSLSTAQTTVVLDKADCHLSFHNHSGQEILSESSGLNNSTLPRTVHFKGMNDKAFYGGGYNGQRIDHDGETLVMNNTQTGGWDNTWSAPHNICIPFFVSTSGYGILFDDHYRNSTMTPSADGTTYSTNSLNPIAYYYIGGNGDMSSVIENYTFLTGRNELPPYWALGYMTSRYGYKTQDEAKDVVKRIKECQLPLDAIIFDIYWQGNANNSGMGNLDWYTPNFPDAKGMMQSFKEQGVNTVCITEPFFTSQTSNYAPMKKAGYFADDNVGGMGWLQSEYVGLIDASNPSALDYMWNFYRDRTLEGVAGWWLDLGEPEQHDADSKHQGGTVNQIHNEYNDLWVERVYRGLKEEFPDVRPFIMPRSGTSGMQRYATFPWTGDIRRSWNGLKAQIPALLSSGMSGVAYMGSDVGGFAASDTDAELYLRWIEFATFSPMMRTHSPHLPEPYNDAYANVLPAVRNFLNMRYSYLPYTYTLSYENATKGTPLARPINFYDASEPDNCIDQYLWGKDILVAPVIDNADNRSIYFPKGEWIDLNDMKTLYPGNTTTRYNAPLDCLPHFARKGSFITRFSQESYTNTSTIDNATLSVTYFMSDNGATDTGYFYDDDKLSTSSIADGAYLLTHFTGTSSEDADEITVSTSGYGYNGMPQQRIITFTIPHYRHSIAAITSQSGPVSKVASRDVFDRSTSDCYFMDEDLDMLHIKVSNPKDILITRSTASLGTADFTDRIEIYALSEAIAYRISASDIVAAHISIIDLSGRTVLKVDHADTAIGTYTIDCSNLNHGIYLATIKAINQSGDIRTLTRKVVIK